jgi:hypothetical protein
MSYRATSTSPVFIRTACHPAPRRCRSPSARGRSILSSFQRRAATGAGRAGAQHRHVLLHGGRTGEQDRSHPEIRDAGWMALTLQISDSARQAGRGDPLGSCGGLHGRGANWLFAAREGLQHADSAAGASHASRGTDPGNTQPDRTGGRRSGTSRAASRRWRPIPETECFDHFERAPYAGTGARHDWNLRVEPGPAVSFIAFGSGLPIFRG